MITDQNPSDHISDFVLLCIILLLCTLKSVNTQDLVVIAVTWYQSKVLEQRSDTFEGKTGDYIEGEIKKVRKHRTFDVDQVICNLFLLVLLIVLIFFVCFVENSEFINSRQFNLLVFVGIFFYRNLCLKCSVNLVQK